MHSHNTYWVNHAIAGTYAEGVVSGWMWLEPWRQWSCSQTTGGARDWAS